MALPENSPIMYLLPMEEDDENQQISEMEVSMRAVENLLGYRFKNRKLLEDALTHPSYIHSPSYERLEFLGDAALGLAISNYFFLKYPQLDPGKLTLVCSANSSTERLARVAVRHQLHMYFRHNFTALDEKVREFVMAVQREEEAEFYGGLVKAPKVLADIVESLAAAVYMDCNFDLQAMWMIFGKLLEPMVMLEALEQQPQPIAALWGLCRKDGKQVDIQHSREGEKIIASVYVDGNLVASASSDQRDTAKLHAAKEALKKLSYEPNNPMNVDILSQINCDNEIGAKQRLLTLCGKMKWPKPNYKIQSDDCHTPGKRFKCSVEIELGEGMLFVMGDVKSRLKEAENSAASTMLRGLKDSNYI